MEKSHKVRWILVLLGLFLISLSACDLKWNAETLTPRERHKMDVPMGWNLVRGRTKMLARSYPRDRWISLMLTLQNKPQKLFSVRPVKLPSVMDIINLFQGRDNPMQRRKKRRKKVTLYGITFLFRNAETLPLEVRLLQKQGKGRSGRVIVFSQPLLLAPTKKRWTRKILWFRDFREKNKPKSKRRAKASPALRLEFWELPRKGLKVDTRSLTVVGPALWTKKPAKSASSQPSTRAGNRPSSRPVARQTGKALPPTRPAPPRRR